MSAHTTNSLNAALPDVAGILNSLVPLNAPPSAPPRFQTQAKGVTVPVHYLVNPTDRQAKSVMTAMTLVGRANDDSPTKWQTLVLTWSCLVFPELVNMIRDASVSPDYRLVPLEASFVKECEDAIVKQANPETAGEIHIGFPASLPNTTLVPMTPHVASCAPYLEGLYAYYAMLVFILGKSLTPEIMSAIASKRPDALIRKRKLHKSEYILKGDGRIAQDNYGNIQSGWVRSTAPRVIIITHLANLYASTTRPETLDPIVVNMDMVRNAGQTYFYYVYDLLVSCPWCLEIPSLAASYRHFSRMVNILARVPEHIRPFYKLMMQDSTKDIRRRDIEMLIGVAIFYAAQTRSTMKQYRVSPDCKPVVQAFIALAAARGITFTEVTGQAVIEVSTV